MVNNANQEIVSALEFVSVLLKRNGMIADKYIRLNGGMAYMNNGIVSSAHPIPTDMNATIDASKFLSSAKMAKDKSYTLVQIDDRSVAIGGDGFRWVIDALDAEDVQVPTGNARMLPCSDLLKQCFVYMRNLLNSKADTPLEKTIQITSETCQLVAYDRKMIIQGWHGVNLGGQSAVVPEDFVVAVAKCKLSPVGMGLSKNSLTVWYENNAFIKTHLYDFDYPSLTHLFDKIPSINEMITPPSDFVTTLRNMQKLSDKGSLITFGKNSMQNSPHDEISSVYETPWLSVNIKFNLDQLISIDKLLDHVQFCENPPMVFFMNGLCRGMVTGIVKKGDAIKLQTPNGIPVGHDYDDDIPF